jgi:hypothetical protein
MRLQKYGKMRLPSVLPFFFVFLHFKNIYNHNYSHKIDKNESDY